MQNYNSKFKIIRKELPGVKENISLAKYTTFRIGGPAKYFFAAKTRQDLIKGIWAAKKLNLPFFILGGGSNLLVADEGYKGLIILFHVSCFMFHEDKVFIGAGTPLALIVNESVKRGLAGLEWAAGIPGTIGGAIRGNAGAFREKIQDIVKKVEAFDTKDQKFKILQNKDCKFGYRNSIFKQNPNLIIFSCQLQLKTEDKQKIKDKMLEYFNYRKRRQPKLPSAGSVFKNVMLSKLKPGFFRKFPEAKKVIKENALPSAFLIDRCHLRGKKIGRAQISEIHPNFIVNLGEAKAKDVIELIRLIKKKVKEKFGIEPEEEIQPLGF